VGSDLAAHVRPEAFEPDQGGRLVLRADSTAWATQVRLLLPQLRARIDAELGRGVVRDITVVGPAAPSWSAGPRRVRGRGPRDTYG
jgi:predicted nucleic acid-binding Zn ribbon protein